MRPNCALQGSVLLLRINYFFKKVHMPQITHSEQSTDLKRSHVLLYRQGQTAQNDCHCIVLKHHLSPPILWFVYFFLKICLFLLYVHGSFARVCLCVMCVQWSQRPEEGGWSSRTGALDGCQLPRGCWESSLGSLEEESVPLTSWSHAVFF